MQPGHSIQINYFAFNCLFFFCLLNTLKYFIGTRQTNQTRTTAVRRWVGSSVCPPKTHLSSSSAFPCEMCQQLIYSLWEIQSVGGSGRGWQGRWRRGSRYFFLCDFLFLAHSCDSSCIPLEHGCQMHFHQGPSASWLPSKGRM